MKLNLAIIVSILTLLIGIVFNKSSLWIPISVLIAGIIDLFTRQWVASPRLGSSQSLSAILKLIFALIGFYAMLGILLCLGVLVFWFL